MSISAFFSNSSHCYVIFWICSHHSWSSQRRCCKILLTICNHLLFVCLGQKILENPRTSFQLPLYRIGTPTFPGGYNRIPNSGNVFYELSVFFFVFFVVFVKIVTNIIILNLSFICCEESRVVGLLHFTISLFSYLFTFSS